ncbi:MAG: creatininase family protein [Gemmatimonadetes bacterium]|nr:creatininase family protein [Gemmatimonadota bacterium]
MPGRPYVLAEAPWKIVQATAYDVAVLPWGATEAHNYHLPYGTDVQHAERIAAEAARRAWEAGARPVVLPAVPFGVNTSQLDIPLTINLNPSTQLAVLDDVAASLEAQGIDKLVVLNGHGGNDFRWIIRELLPHRDIFIAAVDWWKVADARAYFDEPGDHAGELETSVMMHLLPDLVLPLEEAGAGAARAPKLAALRAGWAWTPRRWTQVTADTGVGDPRRATAEKGARYVEAVTGMLAEFLVELAKADVADLYENRTGGADEE